MRKFIAAIIVFTALILVFTSGGYSQPGKGKGNKGGKGGFDLFAKVSRGASVIDLATTESQLKGRLIEFAQSRGITDGKITREHFDEFMKSGMGMKGKGPPQIAAPGSPTKSPMEVWGEAAEKSFNALDTNGDKFLVKEEMPKYLLDVLDKWDKDKNGKLDLPEYKAFYIARMQESLGKDFSKFNAANAIATIIIEEDWDRRPVVLRAEHLHKDLPPWFKDLDKNKDGQVSLKEWMDAKKSYDDFQDYDLNDDGYLTQEEVLRQEALVKAGKDAKANPSIAANVGKFGGIFPQAGNGDGSKKGKGMYGGKKGKKPGN
jgi:Ca2+-binding EF-hand superfamily protein